MELATLLESVVDKLHTWLEIAVQMLPNLVVALVVVLAFGLAARWISRGVGRALERISSNAQITALLTQLVRLGIITMGIFVALGLLNLDKTVTSLLAGVGIIGLALGFAFQDIAANFVSGVLMAARRPFEVGDLVEISGIFGHVRTINLRSTLVCQLTGEIVTIPNKDVFQNPIVNYTNTAERRVDIAVGVSYGDDLRRARSAATEAVERLDCRVESHDVQLFYTGFGGSSIDFTLRFWIASSGQADFLSARSEAIMAIKDAFDEHGISIPFPIRTLEFNESSAPLSLRRIERTEDAAAE